MHVTTQKSKYTYLHVLEVIHKKVGGYDITCTITMSCELVSRWTTILLDNFWNDFLEMLDVFFACSWS